VKTLFLLSRETALFKTAETSPQQKRLYTWLILEMKRVQGRQEQLFMMAQHVYVEGRQFALTTGVIPRASQIKEIRRSRMMTSNLLAFHTQNGMGKWYLLLWECKGTEFLVRKMRIRW
jgi:hypothetical protein